MAKILTPDGRIVEIGRTVEVGTNPIDGISNTKEDSAGTKIVLYTRYSKDPADVEELATVKNSTVGQFLIDCIKKDIWQGMGVGKPCINIQGYDKDIKKAMEEEATTSKWADAPQNFFSGKIGGTW